ncbi:MAG TPA: translocation/assembly module TamB domain-containing protein [Solimonas sp.]|nr:translocation/assembly module TamB domain-containing protein [Solimonas sp.]
MNAPLKRNWKQRLLLELRHLAQLLGGLMLFTLMVAWVLGTPAGTRFGIGQLQHWVPGLQIGAVEGSLLGPLELRRLVFENEGVRVHIDRARLDWRPWSLWLRRLRIRDLDVGHVQVWVKDQPPDNTPSDPPVSLPLGLRIDRAAVARLDLQLPRGQPPLLVEKIELQGRWVGSRVRLKRLAATLPQSGPLEASGSVRLSRERIRIDRLQLKGPGETQLQGWFAYVGEFDLGLQWKELRWPLLGEAQWRSPSGKINAAGSFDRFRYDLKTRLAEARAQIDVEAEGEGSRQALQLKRLAARGLGGRLDARADVAWAPQLRIEADGQFKGIHPEQLLPELAGVLNGRFKVDTSLVDSKPQIDFDATLDDSVWRGHRIELQARGRYAGDTLTLSKGELRSAGTQLRVEGRLWPTLDASAELASPDLSPLWPGLGGRVQAQLQAQGPVQGPRLKADVSAQSLRWQATSLAALTLQAEADLRGEFRPDNLLLRGKLDARQFDGGSWRAAQLTLDGDLDTRGRTQLAARLSDAVAGIGIASATLDISGNVRQQQIRLAAKTDEGDAELLLRGAADLAALRWRGQLASGRLAPEKLAAWTLDEPAALDVSASEQSLQPACWSSDPARACLRLLRNAQLQRLALRLEQFRFAYLQPYMPEKWRVDGAIGGSAQVDLRPDGRLGLLRADLSTTAGNWSVGERKLFEFKPGQLQLLQQGEGALQALLDLPFAQGLVRLDARLAPGAVLMQRPLSGELQLALPELDWLRLFTPEVTSVQGSIDGRFRLAGTPAHPLAQGELNLREAKLRLATPGIEISGIRGVLRGGADGLLALDLSGFSGGGEIRIAGNIDPRTDPVAADIRISGKDFQAARLPDARIWVSPDLKLSLQQRQLKIEGEVQVPRAEITPADFASGSGPSSDQLIVGRDGRPAEPKSLLKLLANIRLVLGDKVTFKGYGLTSRLTGAVGITEETGRATRATGEISLVGGRYKAYGQDLSIKTGRLIYAGGFITEPALELRAERAPTEDVTVGVTVRGTLDHPQFSLYSTPAMTQQQQLAWLVLGRPLESSGGDGDRSMLANAALALGLSGGDFLAQRLRSSVGIDEISIGSKPGESSDRARLTIGKYLSPKLYVSYGIGIFQPGNVFKLIYDLGHGFKLQTESGVEAGGDLLYTIER